MIDALSQPRSLLPFHQEGLGRAHASLVSLKLLKKMRSTRSMKQLTIAQNFSHNCFTEFLKLSMQNNNRAQFHNSRTCQFLGVLPKHVIFCLIFDNIVNFSTPFTNKFHSLTTFSQVNFLYHLCY